jgi:non-ribosomal peptide synthetase component F
VLGPLSGTFFALLAILKAGAAYLPLDPSFPLARLSSCSPTPSSPLLLTTEALADELPTQWTLPLLLDTDWDVIALNLIVSACLPFRTFKPTATFSAKRMAPKAEADRMNKFPIRGNRDYLPL